MKKIIRFSGKLLYAITFLILIPSGLWFWAQYTLREVQLPAIESRTIGMVMMIAGGLFMVWAMMALKHFGKGLPMNAFPPPVFVTRGPYRVFRHPIYWGFGILMTGYFIFSGSASGFWMVAPLTILGMVALVMGYENIDLKQRFPGQKTQTILSLPENKNEAPHLRDRLASVFWVSLMLLLSNVLIASRGFGSPDLRHASVGMINGINILFLPLLNMLFICAIPFFLNSKNGVREWAISAILSLGYLVFIALPSPVIRAVFLMPEVPYLIAVPVFLVFISLNALYRQSAKIAVVFTFIALVLVGIQFTNSRSTGLYFAVSTVIFLLSAFYRAIWFFIKTAGEKIANSWKEWVFWKIRVINHGMYAGLGTFFVIFGGGVLAGGNYAPALMICSMVLTICAALWAQVIEGSEKLKRPFGYYGSVAGLLLGSLVVWFMGLSVWVVMGVGSVVMPWGQALGRLRCLVNGCCHGCRTSNDLIGIRFFHSRSRVNNISGLRGELLHPTQLYSIVWLFFVGVFLFTLWNNHVSNPLIFGLYLILTSLGRFVEEAYRGEAQTPVITGLRLYQWVAVVVAITGIAMTCIRTEPVAVNPGFCWGTLGYAALGGFFSFFAMGVDFPYSNVRFSRLV
jgi:protein-S-isoprenylcysteine O-methyltransferase Ste14